LSDRGVKSHFCRYFLRDQRKKKKGETRENLSIRGGKKRIKSGSLDTYGGRKQDGVSRKKT